MFRAVAEHGGFVGAQVALALGQPAISFHIRALEERLGFRLCHRGRSGFALTEKGRLVYEHTKTVFSTISDFESAIGEMRHTLSGTLRLGIVENTVSDPRLPLYEVIDDFMRMARRASLELIIGGPEQLVIEIVNHGLDVVVVPEMRRQEGLVYSQFYEEVHSLYAARHHPIWRDSEAPDRAAVERYRFVVRPYANLREFQHFKPSSTPATASSTEAQTMLILSGHYLGYLPDHYARPWVDGGRLAPLLQAQTRILSPFFLVTRERQHRSLLVRSFIELLASKPWARFPEAPA